MCEIYKLKANGYIIEVVPSCGFNCISITNPKLFADVLRTPESIDMLKGNHSFIFGTPILFFPNRIGGGKFEFEGRSYVFPINEPKLNNYIHGYLHKYPFEITKHGENTIEGVFRSTSINPYMGFMHEFDFYIEYKIGEDGVHQTVRVKNNSDKNMPFAAAFHTTFNLPFTKGEKAEDISVLINAKALAERNGQNFLPTGRKIKKFDFKESLEKGEFKPFGKAVSYLFELEKKEVRLINSKENVSVIYSFDEKYKYCMAFNGGANDFLCLEPQTWLTNCPNIENRFENGFLFIEPGKEICLENVIRVE